MAKENRPREGEQETTSDSHQDVVLLQVSEDPESDPNQELEAAVSSGNRVPVDSGRELDLLGKRQSDSRLRAKELGVGWDTAGKSSVGRTPMGWLVLIGVLLVVLGGWAAITLTKGEISLKGQEAE